MEIGKIIQIMIKNKNQKEDDPRNEEKEEEDVGNEGMNMIVVLRIHLTLKQRIMKMMKMMKMTKMTKMMII
jgi:hypothetical protein